MSAVTDPMIPSDAVAVLVGHPLDAEDLILVRRTCSTGEVLLSG